MLYQTANSELLHVQQSEHIVSSKSHSQQSVMLSSRTKSWSSGASRTEIKVLELSRLLHRLSVCFAFLLQLTYALHALSEYDCMSLTSIGKYILQQALRFTYLSYLFLEDKVLVLRCLKDKNQSLCLGLGLEGKSYLHHLYPSSATKIAWTWVMGQRTSTHDWRDPYDPS